MLGSDLTDQSLYTDSVPVVSHVVSTFATVAFLVTSFVSGLLTISTASLQSVGAISRPTSVLTSEPSRNLFVC